MLAKQCYSCHGPEQQASALRVDSHAALLRGGKRGPAIIPGDAQGSLLLRAIRHEDLRMPIGSKLKDADIAAFDEWIRKGAVWPDAPAATAVSTSDRYAQLIREHWAFQPVKKPPVPAVSDRVWSKDAVDRFVFDRLQKAGLRPAAPAERRVLIRRLNFVLTGLPPTAEETDAFVNDKSSGAYERLVDRILASPRFGEHWARHWMDLVRFGETRGYEWNYEIIGAWRYRDYLIRAFNNDVPYDQFVREHIAGDLLKTPRVNRQEKLNESVIGTAFYRLGEAGHDDCVMFRDIALDVIDNQIDTLTKTFQGLTVSCARCHNHKLDPIPTEDYYSLYSILNSSRVVTHTIDLPEVNAQPAARLRQLKGDIRSELARLWQGDVEQAVRYLLSTGVEEPATGVETARLQAWRKAFTLADQKLDDPAYVWATLARNAQPGSKLPTAAVAEIVEKYRREAAERDTFNRENYQPLGELKSWFASGSGLRDPLASSGEFAVNPEGDEAISGILPQGLYSHLLSSRLNGALRSPDLPKTKKFLSVRIMGGHLAARRTVIDNCAIGENYKVLESSSPTWIKLETLAAQPRLPVFVELVTRWDNPRIPDRPDVLKPAQLKLLENPRSYFGITDAVLHDANESPRDSLSHILPLFQGGAPADWPALAQAYARTMRSAVENWASGRATDDRARWLDWMVRNGLLSKRADASPVLAALVAEYRKIDGIISEARVVEGLADMSAGTDFPVLIGGDVKNPGALAPRRFLKNILNAEPYQQQGSGRRELAEAIASPANPLTARVMVNRIWRHVFGRGIVQSVDNFGIIGDKPSHPELLDYLAADFMGQGWSIKKTIRQLVLSQTFRQGSRADAAATESDPENTLLHHYPIRRLEAESIRDAILMTSGKLGNSLFGPSTDPHRDQPKEYRRLFSGPLDGARRRSLYLKVTRMEGTRLLDMFDYPSPMTTRGNRDATNVPAQSLTLLNDPFVHLQAEAIANRVLERPGLPVESRITALFRAALSRDPSAVEKERFRGLAAEIASLHHAGAEDARVWKDLAHTVINMKEFIYVQ